VARFASTVEGVKIKHRFAQKYHCKGLHDASGKVANAKIRALKLERKKRERVANAKGCFLVLRRELRGNIKGRKDWSAIEQAKGVMIMQKGIFTVTQRRFGYVTEKRDEYEKMRNDYHHIVFSDRENVPQGTRVKNTQKLHEVEGFLQPNDQDPDKWKLKTSRMSCSCLACRGVVEDPCPYKHIIESKAYCLGEGAK
jgi:hypothetical protein